MKFLFLNFAGIWGGNEKWTHMAATSLSKKFPTYIAYKNDVVGERYSIEKYKLPFRFSYDPSTISSLTSLVKRNGINIIIPTKKRDYVIAGIVARLTGAQNILRLGIVRALGNNPYKYLVYNRMADGIIVNARPIKNELLKSPFMQNQKIRVIYNGLDIDALDLQLTKKSMDDKPFPFIISTVGRVSRRKGVDIIIKVFAEFLRKIDTKEAGLIIVGGGDRFDTFKKLVDDLGISEQVIFTGFVENPYLYVRMSDVYITVSQNEGISNALLEAMYLEKAVVTSRAGGVEEGIVDSHNGLLLESRDIESGADRLVQLFRDNALRSSLGEKARITVKEKFSIDKMTDDITEFCYEITKGEP